MSLLINCMRYIKYSILIFCILPSLVRSEVLPPISKSKNLIINSDLNEIISRPELVWDDSGGYDTDNPGLWNGNVMVCLSESNTTYGACETNIYNGKPSAQPTSIYLKLTERRSGAIINVETYGYKGQYFENAADNCQDFGHVFLGSKMNSVTTRNCSSKKNKGYGFVIYSSIYSHVSDMFPFAGVWEGTLKLNELDKNGSLLATWTANLQYNITDANHIDIYFPEFGTAAPLVPLNIHPTGGASPTPGGQDVTNLDMCLYDGFNVNSSKYEVLLEDGNHHTPAGRPMGWFSVYRDGGDENQPRDRIDYQVRMNNPETDAMMDVRNGELITWNAVNTHRVRPVRLPAISYPVLCAPTPLEFRVNKFATADKNAGQYHGTLRVTFTPTTTTL